MRHANNLGAVRLIAASLVVAGHSFVLLGQTPPAWFGWPMQEAAVLGFFVISGYLVSESWLQDPDWGRYAGRRALRIMPGLLAVVALTVGIGAALTRLPVGAYVRDPGTAAYLWNAALAPVFALPGVFEDGRPIAAVNGALWSLPVEAAMYALLPLYASRRAWCLRGALPVLLLSTAAASFAFMTWDRAQVAPVIWWSSVPFALRYMAYFVTGAAVRLYRAERWLNLQAALLLIVIGHLDPAPLVQGAIGLLAAPYAVLSFGLARAPVLGWVGQRTDVSYGLYLWGFPIQQMTLSTLGHAIDPALLTLMALPLAGLAGWASWRWIEAPALRWKPHTPAVTALA